MPIPLPSSRPREAKLFHDKRGQAVRIPVEFELPGDRVLIRREGGKLIIERVSKPSTISELLAEWQKEAPLGPDDQFPDIEDMPAQPETIFRADICSTRISSATSSAIRPDWPRAALSKSIREIVARAS